MCLFSLQKVQIKSEEPLARKCSKKHREKHLFNKMALPVNRFILKFSNSAPPSIHTNTIDVRRLQYCTLQQNFTGNPYFLQPKYRFVCTNLGDTYVSLVSCVYSCVNIYSIPKTKHCHLVNYVPRVSLYFDLLRSSNPGANFVRNR